MLFSEERRLQAERDARQGDDYPAYVEFVSAGRERVHSLVSDFIEEALADHISPSSAETEQKKIKRGTNFGGTTPVVITTTYPAGWRVAFWTVLTPTGEIALQRPTVNRQPRLWESGTREIHEFDIFSIDELIQPLPVSSQAWVNWRRPMYDEVEILGNKALPGGARANDHDLYFDPTTTETNSTSLRSAMSQFLAARRRTS